MGNQQPTSTCYLSFENSLSGKLYIGFDGRDNQNYLGSYTHSEFKPSGRINLYRGNPYVSLLLEWGYQNAWGVPYNPRFANQRLQSFNHQCRFILETPHGGNTHSPETRSQISSTMKEKKLGTFNPSVREAGNAANRGKKRTEEQKLRIQAASYAGILKKGTWPKAADL